jgi:hypothetical protein
VVGSLGPALQRPETLGRSAGQIGWRRRPISPARCSARSSSGGSSTPSTASAFFSSRWRSEEAEAIVRAIEREVGVEHEKREHLVLRPLRSVPWGDVLHVLALRHHRRAVLGLTLMASQEFFYNAIFFTYALVLARFYGVADERVGFPSRSATSWRDLGCS